MNTRPLNRNPVLFATLSTVLLVTAGLTVMPASADIVDDLFDDQLLEQPIHCVVRADGEYGDSIISNPLYPVLEDTWGYYRWLRALLEEEMGDNSPLPDRDNPVPAYLHPCTGAVIINGLFVDADGLVQIDEDDDGMGDAWQASWGTSQYIVGGAMDPDGDDLDNLGEFE